VEIDKEIKRLFRSYRVSFPPWVKFSRETSDQQVLIRVFYEFMHRGGDLEYVRSLVRNYEVEVMDEVTYLKPGDTCPIHGKPLTWDQIDLSPQRIYCKDCNRDEVHRLEPEGAWT